MNIVKATRKFEDWLGQHTPVVGSDLRIKHQSMAQAQFPFLRATFYRWVQVWPEVCGELNRAPRVLAVGDLHVENFGTWRDTDGRLVWGINDFDEASEFPYTMDLVRLATSALLAAREQRLSIKLKDAAGAILAGYRETLKEGGRPFVLGEDHGWLRQIAESELRDPVQFWRKLDQLPAVKTAPASAREAIEHLLPEPGLKYRLAKRVAGLGSLGHMRFVGVADWKGGRVAREAKALVPSSIDWLDPKAPGEILYSAVLKCAVRCPDPYVQLRGHWIVRRLSPHCSRIELENLQKSRDEVRLLAAMGRETANIHLGSEGKRKAVLEDLRRRKGNWLVDAAEAMANALQKDWQAWKEHWS
jgi:hypothetical protein